MGSFDPFLSVQTQDSLERRRQKDQVGCDFALDLGAIQLLVLFVKPDLFAGGAWCYHACHGILHLPVLLEKLSTPDQVLLLVERRHDGVSVLHLPVSGRGLRQAAQDRFSVGKFVPYHLSFWCFLFRVSGARPSCKVPWRRHGQVFNVGRNLWNQVLQVKRWQNNLTLNIPNKMIVSLSGFASRIFRIRITTACGWMHAFRKSTSFPFVSFLFCIWVTLVHSGLLFLTSVCDSIREFGLWSGGKFVVLVPTNCWAFNHRFEGNPGLAFAAGIHCMCLAIPVLLLLIQKSYTACYIQIQTYMTSFNYKKNYYWEVPIPYFEEPAPKKTTTLSA